MDAMKYMTDYHDNFDVEAYLHLNYKMFNDEAKSVEGITAFTLAEKHKFWTNIENVPLKRGELTFLEYGGGPSIVNLTSAAPKVGRIVFSEYTEANRNAVNSWIKGEPNAFDWSSLIRFVVTKLEEDPNPQTVALRMQEIKRKIKSVVPCDITTEPIVDLEPDDVDEGFDVVSATLCLSACTTTAKEYKNAVANLCKLVKPGGRLFLSDVLNGTYYIVGQQKFYCFPIGEKLGKKAMEDAGLVNIYFARSQSAYLMTVGKSDSSDAFAVHGKKPE